MLHARRVTVSSAQRRHRDVIPRMLRVTRQDVRTSRGTFAAHLDVFLVDRATLHHLERALLLLGERGRPVRRR